MANEWKPVTDVHSFLAGGTARTGAHNFAVKKVKHWPYCSNCGLVLLKNEVTRRAARAPCRWIED